MRIFTFFIASIFYIICVGICIFLAFSGDFTLKSPFFEYTLPVYLWIMGIVGLYVVFTILHMIFYGTKISFKNMALDSDKNKFKKYLIDLILKKDNKQSFKTPYYKDIKNMVDSFVYGSSDDADIENVLLLCDKIKNGEVVELRNYGLSKDNALYIQNEKNKASKDLDYAKKILKNITKISNDIEKNAYINILNNASYEDIRGLKIEKSAEDIKLIFSRFNELALNNASVEILLSNSYLTEQDILDIVKVIVLKLEPIAIISILEKLKDDERYFRAYLYTLAYFSYYEKLEQECVDKNITDDFKLVIFLHDKSQKFNLNDIIK